MQLRPDRQRTPKRGDKNKGQLLTILRALFGTDQVVVEHRFHPTRRWRFDYAVPARKLAVEYQGHGATGKSGHIGGHASITGLSGDCEKSNAAQALGWRVLTFTALHFKEADRTKHKLTSPHDTLQSFTTPTS